jgi:uncharacterized protein
MEPPFLGWQFNSLDLGQRGLLTDFLSRHPHSLSGYTFASLVSWDPLFQYGWFFDGSGTLLISCLVHPDRRRHLMQPVGSFPAGMQCQILRETALLPYPLKIVGVGAEFLAQAAGFVRSCDVAEDPAAANYIYLADSLARLSGRKYAKKRNLLSQAQGLYRWTCEPLTAANIAACSEVLHRIHDEEAPEVDLNLEWEVAALERTLKLWGELGQDGVLLNVEGKPAAFSIFEPISSTTVAVHFERALRSYKGLYQVINWETARIIAAKGFELINREEDLGSPGLRDAKRSYAPIRLNPAYVLTLKTASPRAQH